MPWSWRMECLECEPESCVCSRGIPIASAKPLANGRKKKQNLIRSCSKSLLEQWALSSTGFRLWRNSQRYSSSSGSTRLALLPPVLCSFPGGRNWRLVWVPVSPLVRIWASDPVPACREQAWPQGSYLKRISPDARCLPSQHTQRGCIWADIWGPHGLPNCGLANFVLTWVSPPVFTHVGHT